MQWAPIDSQPPILSIHSSISDIPSCNSKITLIYIKIGFTYAYVKFSDYNDVDTIPYNYSLK